MNVFETVKQSVTTRQAAEHYGIRVGRNGMACCPFHNDKTPSMKLDRRYHCFGCGADGDVIDFTAALYGLGKKEAAVQLVSDFGLSYEDRKPPDKRRKPKGKSPEIQFREAQARCFRVLADYLHLLERWKVKYAPNQPDGEWHPRFVEALQKISHVEYLLDTLLSGDTEERAQIITEYGKDVIELEKRLSELAAPDAARREKYSKRHAAAPDVEEVKAELESTEKGGARQSIRNCLTVFQRDPVLAGAIAYNSLTDRKDIIKPIGYHRTGTALTDTDMKYLLLYLEENYGLTSEKKIENAIGIVANENKYHPIRDCLNNLEWDGTERIRYALHHFLGAEVSEYSYEALKLFMLGAITRAFKPGSKFEIMLCLVGGQGAGKSTFFRLLALRDEWFSDDLRKLDDDNVYRKLQGHWIIEMSEMMATANAKSIEEIKSFLSRQKEVYKIPYETHPADRPRQCVFGGTSNALDFLPLDRSGNRRFIPVMVYPEQSEVHILEDEAASRAYIRQMWAEAMEIYRSGNFKLKFSPEMAKYLKEHQRDFMPEDTKAGQIQAYLDKYTGDTVCSKQLYKEALNHAFDEPKQWEIREVNEIMNQCITGWRYFSNPRMFAGFGRSRCRPGCREKPLFPTLFPF